MGRRHVGYGVRPEHYAMVGEALLWALGPTLGDDFTPATRAAWAKAHGLIASTMIEAGEGGRIEQAGGDQFRRALRAASDRRCRSIGGGVQSGTSPRSARPTCAAL